MIPFLDAKKCTKCLLCFNNCTAKAIDENTIEFNEKKCILCGHCTAICPTEAITINGQPGEVIDSLPEKIPTYFESLVKGRRSIRHYTDKKITRELIEKILHTVNYSPTGTNSRKVGITVLNSKKKVKQLTDIIMRHFQILTKILFNYFTYPLWFIILGKSKTKAVYSYKKMISKYWKGNNILTYDAPLLFIFHADKKSSSPEQDGIIWATTALYYAETLGLGTCFNGFLVIGINTCRKARKFLKIPKNHKIYESFTAGYPLYKYKRAITRNDLMVNFV